MTSDFSQEFGIDPGLQGDGVKTHFQILLAEKLVMIETSLELIRREYPTNIGPVDLLCRTPSGETVAVGVKRRGDIEFNITHLF